MTLPTYLGLCPYCKARVALAARACAGCGRRLAPGEAERAAAREGMYGRRVPRQPAPEEDEGGVTGGVITRD
jgi:hypothetical protein